MPNIKQQKRRVSIAARQRLENLHYRSTAKTLYKRLETAVADGDKEAVHPQLIATSYAASTGPPPRHAMHPNRAARKKSQAARLVAGPQS